MNMQNQIIPLGECGIEIISGQIMSRLSAKEGSGDETVEVRKVVVPKCIHADGSIDNSEMPEESLRTEADPRRLTAPGDIVMKLSTPYDAAYVDEDSAGCIVPSFCAIIKSAGDLDTQFLLAFLNSSACKNQLKLQVSGSAMAMLSVGKIKNVLIPVPALDKQREIGNRFQETRRKVKLLEQIIKLEQKKNDISFRDMVKEYED
jgi:hypothetical protein